MQNVCLISFPTPRTRVATRCLNTDQSACPLAVCDFDSQLHLQCKPSDGAGTGRSTLKLRSTVRRCLPNVPSPRPRPSRRREPTKRTKNGRLPPIACALVGTAELTVLQCLHCCLATKRPESGGASGVGSTSIGDPQAPDWPLAPGDGARRRERRDVRGRGR